MRDREDDAIDRHIAQDLAALRTHSETAPGSAEASIRAALARRADEPKGWTMITSKLKARPGLSLTLGTAFVVAALLVVPLPYTHVVGHSVDLRVAGAKLDATQAHRVASIVKHALHAERVRLERSGDGYLLRAQLRERARGVVDRELVATTTALEKEGVRAQIAGVSARRERVSGTVYALARETIQVRMPSSDESAAQIEADIEAQLQGADIPVHVEKNDTGVVVVIGSTVASESNDVDVAFTDSGDPYVHQVAVQVPPGASDAEIQRAVKAQLEAQGVPGDVTVVNGQISVVPLPVTP